MFTHEDIIQATGAKARGSVPRLSAVTTDSRSVGRGELFVALRGPNFDGHAFAAVAAEKGAAAVMVDHETDCRIPQYVVPDTLVAYQALARFHRSRFSMPVIGITGTNGKTTVKEMAGAMLSRVGAPLTSEQNLNNHVGVPATLLKMNSRHTHAVIEMGMNHPGEIRILSRTALPNVAVITCVGRGHLEFLGTVQAVLRAKLEILDGLVDGGVAVLPYDDAFFADMRDAAVGRGAEVVSFGTSPGADVSFLYETTDAGGTTGILRTPCGETAVQMKLLGAHNCANAAAATAAAMAADPSLALEEVACALDRFAPINLRCQIEEVNGIRVILDCYNANPDSAAAALNALSQVQASGRRVAFLGEMCELGDAAPQCHREVGARAAESGIDMLVAVGAYRDALLAGAEDRMLPSSRARGFAAVTDATLFLVDYARPGDVILVKASRAMHLEDALTALRRNSVAPAKCNVYC